MRKTMLASIIGVSLTTVVLLTGCTAPIVSTPEGTGADPNHINDTDASTILLVDDGTFNSVPKFDTTVTLPDGWTLDPKIGDRFEGENAETPAKSETFAAYSEDLKCSIIGNVQYMDSYNAGRGDLYLSKNYLYQTLESFNAPVANESVITVGYGEKKVQFVTASYDTQIEAPVLNPDNGELTGETTTIPQRGFIAYRVIDLVVDNPYYQASPDSPEGRMGSDPSKSLPVLTIRYECGSDPTLVNEDVWKQLVASLKITD